MRFTMRTTPLLLALALLACSCTNCASTPQVVKDDVHVIAGCDASDVSALLIANGRIVSDVATLAHGGAAAGPAAIDILTQLAAIHALWAHCKTTANSLPPAGAPPASGVVKPEATLPPAASPLVPATTSTVMLVDGARTLPPLVIHDGQGRRIVFSRVGVGATGAHPHAP